MIGRNGERRSGISAQAARHDDDDDDILFHLVKQQRCILVKIYTEPCRIVSYIYILIYLKS